MGKSIRIAGILLAASCSALPSIALAQGQAAAGDDEGAITSSDDIIVTARRREERLQDVPQAIIAFNSEQLTRANVTEVPDLVRITPGLVFQPNSLSNKSVSLTLRAQRQNLPNLTFDPSVVVYFNEIPNMRMMGAATALYDLSSVQVLKGPQGTLFGRNSTGGSLLLTPQGPTDSFGGYVKAGAGNYGMWEAEGALNVPIGQRAALRVAGRHSQHDGYMPVVGKGYSVDDDNTDAYRVSLRVEPVDGLVNTTVFDSVHASGSGTAFRVVGVLGTCLPSTTTGMCGQLNALTGQPWNATTSNVDRNGTNIKAWQVSNITTADLGDITLKNIFGYRKLSSYITTDIDGSALDMLVASDRVQMHQISNEVQLIGKAFNNNLTYQLGGFLFQETGSELQFTPTAGVTSSVSDFSATNSSYSLYGQVTLKVPGMERLSVTAGLRQTWDKREMVNRGKTIFGIYTGYDYSNLGSLAISCRIQISADASQGVINPCEKYASANFNKLTYNFSLDYKITPDVLVYAATRKGYRAGGLFNAPRAPIEFLPYRPELLTDYEVGLKASYSLGTMRGRTNLAVYTGNFKDAQRNTSSQEVFTDSQGRTFTINRNIIFNVDSARVRGFELEQMLKPFDALELNVAYAYTDAKYNKFVVLSPAGAVLADYTKSPFAGAPAHTLSASARLQLPVPESAGRMFAQISGSWISSTYTADGNPMFNGTATTDASDGTPPFSIRTRALVDGYHTFDARLDWESVMGTNLDLSVWVRNLTDEHYFAGGQYVQGLGFNVRNPGTPRTFGVQARYDF
jgi:iron complex outermembrane receptor protein